MNVSGSDPAPFIQMVEELLREGYAVRFHASGWSMYPTIRDGETITVAPLGGSPILTGDLLLYRSGRSAVAHRVVRVASVSGGPTTLLLRGDAADSCDRPIDPGQVLGRLSGVERDGRTMPLDVLGTLWSRAAGRTLRAARRARMTIARIVVSLTY
jgi:hypothetical protein